MFNSPVDDIAVALQVAGLGPLAEEAFPEADAETVSAVLTAAAQMADQLLAPLNRDGDRYGARLENGQVFAAPGFADAYRQYAQGGWTGLAAAAEHGGQGLPKAVSLAVFEMAHAANMAFALCPMLSEAAVDALTAHGTGRQQALYLGKLVSGAWTGTMNLTEPQAGSDLARLRAAARSDGEGNWLVNGENIYITGGEHDAADNIIHLVLARLPDAPAGVKGISLFLVPKRLVDEGGHPSVANSVRVGGIEHKLGIHGSPTCTMLFEDAKAELVGAPNQGLAAMFTMMNSARLNVEIQGVGIAERAYQQALSYARERRQGRSPWSQEATALIFDQPDVRRMLMLMKSKIVAARGVCLATAVAADRARMLGDAAARRREEWLTPLAKAWSTDIGVEVASLGVQVHGGIGFIEETGAAQHYRDARITPIYEGTNGIQAIYLVGRKLGLDGGAATAEMLAEIRLAAQDCEGSLTAFGARLVTGADALETAASRFQSNRDAADRLAGATEFLTLAGEVVGGWVHARAAVHATRNVEAHGTTRMQQQNQLARFYGEQVLSLAPARLAAATADARDLHAWTA